jgi:geranylgeranyl diphosphate synthase type II
MGAIIAGASDAECDALYSYGYELGMAFQVADDYLDAYGDVKVFGKPIGGDILNGKKSWLTVRALEKSSDREAFLAAFDAEVTDEESGRRKIESVKALYDALGVAADARAEIERFSSRAMEAVSGIGLGADALETLRRFAASLVGRVK